MTGWRGQLDLHYRDARGARGALPARDAGRGAAAHTLAHDRHEGPLRVLRPLYPEGPAICHHVIVHPPGGVVGGDELHITARLDAGAHALVTTPGATRFYRSAGAPALQRVRLRLAPGARLEWLPLETLAYSGCEAESAVVAELAPGAEMIGWELLVLGLPAAGAPFVAGRWRQHLELPGRWLERALIAADDRALLDAAAGWAGRRVLGTAWFAAGDALTGARHEALLEAARAAVAASPLRATAGVTAPQPGVLVARLLARDDEAEAARQLLVAVRAAWRREAWALAAEPPRIWRT